MLRQTVYTPEPALRDPLSVLRRTAEQWPQTLQVARQLLVRSIRARYRRALLGFAWAVLPPLANTAVWWFLHAQRIVDLAVPGIPYPAFVLTGMVLWATFADAVQAPLRVAASTKPVLVKLSLPSESLLLVAAGEVAVSLAIRCAVLMVPLAVCCGWPPPTVALMPAGVLFLVVLGLAAGMLLVPLSLLYQDVDHAVGLGLGLLFFLTPVVYPLPQSRLGELLVWLNPPCSLLVATRGWLLGSAVDCLGPLIAVPILASGALLVATLLLRVGMPILVERLSAV